MMKCNVMLRKLFCMIMVLSIIFTISSVNTFAANASVKITSPSECCSYTVGDEVKLSAVVMGNGHKITKFFVKTSDCRKIKLNEASVKKITVSGYISTDFGFSPQAAPYIKSGFIVELIPKTSCEGDILRTETDENGYFKLENVPQIEEGYKMEIKKKNYLTRYVDNLVLTEDTELSSQDSPIVLWVGDFVQDNAINILDAVELVKYFNSYRGDNIYNEDYDVNRDNVVNLLDLVILTNNFGKISNDYEQLY